MKIATKVPFDMFSLVSVLQYTNLYVAFFFGGGEGLFKNLVSERALIEF